MNKKYFIGFDIIFKFYKDQYPMKSYDTPSLYIHTISLMEIGNTIREAPVYHKGYPVWSEFGIWTESYFKETYPYHHEIQKSDYEKLLTFAPKQLFTINKEKANNLFMKFLHNKYPEILI